MAQINIDRILERTVHGPRADGFVLYGKVPEYKAANESEKKEMASAKYLKACENTYNSPTNIRRLFITHSRVDVQYYAPYIIKGKSIQDNWKTRKINSIKDLPDISIKDVAERSIMKELNRTQDIMQQVVDGKGNNTLTGKGLRAIANPWVCSNIEEIYFDYTILATETNKNSIPGLMEVFASIVSGKAVMQESRIPFTVLEGSINVSLDNLRDKFPRLRMIAFISNLDGILNTEKFIRLGRVASVEEAKKTWLFANMNLVKQFGGVNMYFNVNKALKEIADAKGVEFRVDAFNSELDIRPGIYKFDSLILTGVKDRLVKAKETTRINPSPIEADTRSSEVGESEKNTGQQSGCVKSEEEILLDSISERYGAGVLARVMKIAVAGMKKSDIQDLFDRMTPSGKKTYQSLI